MAITKAQRENIQIDYGLVYVDYAETSQRRLAPTRGGATVAITPTYRDIEYDGSKGKEKGMQVLDSVDVVANIPLMDIGMENLAIALPYATLTGDGSSTPYKLTVKSANIGVLPSTAYLINITVFAKLIGGMYKKITLFSPMNEGAFSLAAVPKGEGVVNLEIHAHWDADDDTKDLVEIEDIETITDDTTPPTVITVPADTDTAEVVSNNLTATFSEDVRQGDITADNLVLIKVTDGTVVAGALTYTPATKTATFDPTTNLDTSTAYIWLISGVRDLAGNKMVTVAVNFTTA